MTVKSYRELIAWQKAMDLVVEIYRVSAKFPLQEKYGLTQQLRRSAVSVPSNIAEGQARQSTKKSANCLSITLGSVAEAETQILIGQRLRYTTNEEAEDLLAPASEVGRIINGLKNSLPH